MALTKVLSKEGAPHNVLVNAMLVGRIESDQWLNRWKATDQTKSYDEYLDEMAKDLKLPIGRLGSAEEFANMACFLCSEAGSYINGVAINVDGNESRCLIYICDYIIIIKSVGGSCLNGTVFQHKTNSPANLGCS